MSRAIQRLMKDYRKAEKLVGRTNEPLVDLASAATITSQTMAQIRREPELTQDEKKYLVAVERMEIYSSRRFILCFHRFFFFSLLRKVEIWQQHDDI